MNPDLNYVVDADGDRYMTDFMAKYLVGYPNNNEDDNVDVGVENSGTATDIVADDQQQHRQGVEMIEIDSGEETDKDDDNGARRASTPSPPPTTTRENEQDRQDPQMLMKDKDGREETRRIVSLPAVPSPPSFSSLLAEATATTEEGILDPAQPDDHSNELGDRDADILFLLDSGVSPFLEPNAPSPRSPSPPLSLPPNFIPLPPASPLSVPLLAWHDLPELPPNLGFDLGLEGIPWDFPVPSSAAPPAAPTPWAPDLLADLGFDLEAFFRNLDAQVEPNTLKGASQSYLAGVSSGQMSNPTNTNDMNFDEYLEILFPEQHVNSGQPSKIPSQKVDIDEAMFEQAYRDVTAIMHDGDAAVGHLSDNLISNNQDTIPDPYGRRPCMVRNLATVPYHYDTDLNPSSPISYAPPISARRPHPARAPIRDITPPTAASVAHRILHGRVGHNSKPKVVDRTKWNRQRLDDIMTPEESNVEKLSEYSRVEVKRPDGEIVKVDVGSRSADGMVKFIVQAKEQIYEWEQEVMQL